VLTKDEIAELARQASSASLDKSNKTSNGFDVNDLPISEDAVKVEEATRREEINGVQGNDQEQESVPAVEPSSEQSLPSFQPLMASGILPCRNGWVDFADIAAAPDDSVRNVMMAWYWAGYYTGLHDGSKNPSSK
jgi:hypothetical protein